MNFARSQKILRKVSLTPLIDLVFLLVVFFMLSTNFVKYDIMELNFSKAEEGEVSDGDREAVIISVIDGNFVELNNSKYEIAEFDLKIRRIIEDHPKKDILLRSEGNADIQSMVRIMDILNMAGAKNITITE